MNEFKQPARPLSGTPVSDGDLEKIAGAGSELDNEIEDWKKMSDNDLLDQAARIGSDLIVMLETKWMPGTAQSIQWMEKRQAAISDEVQRRGLSLE